jgi:hypothetical protein
MKKTVALCQWLVADLPAAFNPDLATQNCLSTLGHLEDALFAMEEAVVVCWQLAADPAAAFNPNLAIFLHDLRIHLALVGCQEDSIPVF